MDKPKILESNSVIRFQDCDPFQHLSNSKYIDYLVNAREDQLLANYGLDLYALAQSSGQGYVTASNQIAYLRPALPNECVKMQSQVFAFDEQSSKVEMRMFNEAGTQLKAILWSSFFYFDIRKQQAAKQTKDLLDLHASIVSPIDTADFSERVYYWRKFNKQYRVSAQ